MELDKDQDSKINDSVHLAYYRHLQNHAMPVKHKCFPCGTFGCRRVLSVPSFLHVSDSPLVSMKKKKGIRTAADGVQSGWPVMACSQSSSQAVFARKRS
ncbi:hypothetical protein TNCV_2189831 [Trichonephila clavipes]|nr:hypothetical protein TNCV_2189831 [Trichonephila clavipes]